MQPKHPIQLQPLFRTLSTPTRSSFSPNPTARMLLFFPSELHHSLFKCCNFAFRQLIFVFDIFFIYSFFKPKKKKKGRGIGVGLI